MNLLFDLDGTLTDPFEGITGCIAYALNALGLESPPVEELKWCIGPPLKSSFAVLLERQGADPGLAGEVLLIYRERFALTGLYENHVFEGIPDALLTLQQAGHLLFVATAKPEIFARQILAHFRLDHFFLNIYGSELDGTRSEKTDLIAYILEKESISPDHAWMVGDRSHDMIGAANNGIGGAGVSWGYGTRIELDRSGALVIFENPTELGRYFGRSAVTPTITSRQKGRDWR